MQTHYQYQLAQKRLPAGRHKQILHGLDACLGAPRLLYRVSRVQYSKVSTGALNTGRVPPPGCGWEDRTRRALALGSSISHPQHDAADYRDCGPPCGEANGCAAATQKKGASASLRSATDGAHSGAVGRRWRRVRRRAESGTRWWGADVLEEGEPGAGAAVQRAAGGIRHQALVPAGRPSDKLAGGQLSEPRRPRQQARPDDALPPDACAINAPPARSVGACLPYSVRRYQ